MGFRRKSSDLNESVSHLKYQFYLFYRDLERKPFQYQCLFWYSNVLREFRNFLIRSNIARGSTGMEHFIF